MLCKWLAYCTLRSKKSRLALANCKVMEYVPMQWWSKQFGLLLCSGQHNYLREQGVGILIPAFLFPNYKFNLRSLFSQRVWHIRGVWSLFLFISLFERLVAVAAVILLSYNLQDRLAMNFKYIENKSVKLSERFWKEIPECLPAMLAV